MSESVGPVAQGISLTAAGEHCCTCTCVHCDSVLPAPAPFPKFPPAAPTIIHTLRHSGLLASIVQQYSFCCPCAYLPGLFAGAALYISTVEVPAAAETGTAFHYAFFPHMFRRWEIHAVPHAFCTGC